MLKIFFVLVIFIKSNLLFSQQEITRLTELQKIFFVSEASGLASTSYNPAALGIGLSNSGVILGYDFDNFKNQGNSSVFLTSNNIGISYQDIYNTNNIRLQNYSINLSIGNEHLAIGTTNRYSVAKYSTYSLKLFSFDAGIILKPVSFISFGLLARNLNEAAFDSLNYVRNYTAGIGLILFNETFNLFADVDFKDNSIINELSSTVGIVFSPLNLFEFRGGVVLNPEDIIDLSNNNPIIIDLKYESFISASFLIKNTIRITAAARFNDRGERTRFSAVFGFPFSSSGYQ